MTAQEAYKIVKQENPGMVAIDCIEFDDFFAFGLTDKGFEDELCGGGFITVNKISGKTGGYTPTENLEAFVAAKRIDIDTLN